MIVGNDLSLTDRKAPVESAPNQRGHPLLTCIAHRREGMNFKSI